MCCRGGMVKSDKSVCGRARIKSREEESRPLLGSTRSVCA